MNWGPKSTDDQAEVIPLRQYSDVVFLAWQKAAGDKIKGLKYIFRHHITNANTLAVILEVLEKRGEQAKPWPGLQISMTERDAWALLGTPNGVGAAWLLIQHKEQLGMKSISAVTIYKCVGAHYCLCFWIEELDHEGVDMEVPPDLQTPPTGGGGASTAGETAKRAVTVANNDVATTSTAGFGERLMRAISKRTGDVVRYFGTGLRLF